MDHTKNELDRYECFGVPQHVHVEDNGSAARVPPGWGRRDWLLREAAHLGAEATPSPPMPPALELDIVR